jgi:hypothetical protein
VTGSENAKKIVKTVGKAAKCSTGDGDSGASDTGPLLQSNGIHTPTSIIWQVNIVRGSPLLMRQPAFGTNHNVRLLGQEFEPPKCEGVYRLAPRKLLFEDVMWTCTTECAAANVQVVRVARRRVLVLAYAIHQAASRCF